MLKIQDYDIGDLIKINGKYLGVVTKINKWSIESVAIDYPHKQNQIFITTLKYISSITKVTHE